MKRKKFNFDDVLIGVCLMCVVLGLVHACQHCVGS